MRRAVKVVTTAVAFVTAGAVATTLNSHQRAKRLARRGEELEFGSVRSRGRIVHGTDGVALHVEVDDGPDGVTVVFVHGWGCTMDAWHYQRAGLRGSVRMVFLDQRSHGRSGRSYGDNSSLAQLAEDLRVVLDTFVRTDDIVLVGHSMGGMTIMALAAAHPDLFGDRIRGVVLCSTSAGGLVRGSPALRFAAPLIARASPVLDFGRAFNSYSVVRRWAVGPRGQERHIDMTNEMLLQAPTSVFLDFYRIFVTLDLRDALDAVGKARTVVVGGTRDLLTPFKHSRRLAATIPGATLVAVEGAGHMVIFEEHDRVTGVIADMVESLS